MESWPLCPICNGESSPAFYAAEHRMYRCTNCYLSFVYPLPAEGYLKKFYSHFHKTIDKGGGYEFFEDRMKADIPAKIKLIKSALPRQSKSIIRLLDVGCGKGYFVSSCSASGLQAEGIDLSDTAIEYATKNLGVQAMHGRIEDLYTQIGPYDVVTLWATIEHLVDPLATLSAIKKVLKPGGLLFLDTGIGNDWLDKLLPGYVQWYDPPQHLFVFSKKSMVLLLSDAGFSIENINPCFERSKKRLLVRICRGFLCGIGLRMIAEITRLHGAKPFHFTRFPIGNLMSVIARTTNSPISRGISS